VVAVVALKPPRQRSAGGLNAYVVASALIVAPLNALKTLQC
jgi:hypothetical protein